MLPSRHWRPPVHAALSQLLRDTPPGRLAVFDFDNTLIARDIGDAAFEVLARSRRLTDPVAGLFPSIDPKHAEAPLPPHVWFDRYDALLGATDHQGVQATRAVAYAWIVQAMAGRTPADIAAAAREAWTTDLVDRRYPRPFFYTEMVDLAGALLHRGWEVAIVSASNPWTVRWAVQEVLNPMLAERHGVTLPPERVFGLGVLLRDTHTGAFYTDPYLAATDPAYARLDPDALARFRLTAQLAPPLSTYGGKVAVVRQHLGAESIELAAGDTFNDFELLREARHRLWIARLDRPELQAALAARMAGEERDRWWIQAALTDGGAPGFVASAADLARRGASPGAERAWAVWDG